MANIVLSMQNYEAQVKILPEIDKKISSMVASLLITNDESECAKYESSLRYWQRQKTMCESQISTYESEEQYAKRNGRNRNKGDEVQTAARTRALLSAR